MKLQPIKNRWLSKILEIDECFGFGEIGSLRKTTTLFVKHNAGRILLQQCIYGDI